MSRRCVTVAVALSLLSLISPLVLLSQTELASLVGTVRDPVSSYSVAAPDTDARPVSIFALPFRLPSAT